MTKSAIRLGHRPTLCTYFTAEIESLLGRDQHKFIVVLRR